MGIELSEKELTKLLQVLPMDDAGKVSENKLLHGVKSIKGGVVKSQNLDTTLGKLEMNLTKKEHADLIKILPFNSSGKVHLPDLLQAAKSITGEEVDVQNVLENMGVILTDQEYEELLKSLPVNENGKLYQNRLMDSLKSLNDAGKVSENKLLRGVKSIKGGIVKSQNLNTALGKLEINLTKKDADLIKILPVNSSGKVHLHNLLEAVKSITGEEVDVSDLRNVVENMGVTPTDQEYEELVKSLPLDASGKVQLENLVEAVKSITGEEVDVTDVKNVLENMGVTLTDQKYEELLKSLPIDENGKLYQNRLMDSLKSLNGKKISAGDIIKVLGDMGIELSEKELKKLLQVLPMDGGIVKSQNLDTALGKLEINLNKKEHADLIKILPFNSSGKVQLCNLLEAVKFITGEEVDFNDVRNVLENMGITLTDQEYEELLKSLPVNENGKLYQNRLMDSLKFLNGGLANVKKIDSILENMGWKLTKEEIKDLRHNLPINVQASNNIPMKTLLDGVKPFTGEKMDVRNVPDMLSNMCLELTNKEQMMLLSELPVDVTGKVYKKRLLDGIKSFIGGKVEKNKMDTVLENLKIVLTEKELGQLTDSVSVTESGKVNFNELMDKVKIITGDEENINEVENILENMGIELTEEEYTELVKNLPVDGGKADINKLDIILENMRMNVSEAEFKDMKNNLPVNDDGKAEMTKLIDEMKVFSGEKIHISDLRNTVESIGIDLTEEEFSKLQETLPVDDAEMVFLNRVLDGMKSLKGGKLSVADIDSVLENMGIKLTELELKPLAENITVDDNGKVNFTELMDRVKALTGGEIDGNEVKDILENMGIYPTEKELLKLLKNLPKNENGKIYQNRLMDDITSLKDGTMDVNKLDTFLENMSMKLSETEHKDLTQKLPVDADGKAPLNKVMDEIKKFLVEGKIDVKKVMNEVKDFTGEKVDIKNLKNELRKMGIELANKEYEKLIKTLPFSDDGKVHPIRALKEVTSFKGGKIDIIKLKPLLESLGVKLTEKELEKLTENLPDDANGQVDLMKVMDGVEALTAKGGKVGINNVKTVLEDMGIELKDKELLELVTNLLFDDDEKTFQNRLLEGVKSLKGGKVSVKNLEALLDNLGIKLMDVELKDLIENLPIGVDRKISLPRLLNKLKDFTGEKVDSSDLKNILKNLELELTEKEQQKLLQTLPVDAAGKMYYNRLLRGLKTLEGGMVLINKVHNVLKRLGTNLVEEELETVIETLQVDDDGKVGMKEVMDGIRATTGGEVDATDVKSTLTKMRLDLTDKELLNLMENLSFNDDNKIFKNRLLEGIKSLKVGKVDVDNLDILLENLGIKLEDKELQDLCPDIPADVDGKISLETLLEKVKDFIGKKIDSRNLQNTLESFGIDLTEEEVEDLLSTLPVDEKVDIKNLDTILNDMGIKLTYKELEDLIQSLPVSDDNKISLKSLMKELKAFTGEKIYTSDIKNILKNMGIELSDKEYKELLKTLPVDDDGKVFQNRVLKDLQNNMRGMVSVNNLGGILEMMNVKLTEKEHDQLKDLLRDGYGKIPLEKLMSKVETVTGKKIDVSDIRTILRNLGIELSEKEVSELVNNLPVDDGKVYEKRLLDNLNYLNGGKVDSSKVDEIFKSLGINLSKNELEDLKQNLTVDVDGKTDLKNLMREMRPFVGNKIDLNKIDQYLESLGIDLKPDEYLNFLKRLPVSDDEKVYEQRLLKGIMSLQEGEVDIDKLDTFLEKLGITFSEKEFMDLTEKLTGDGQKKIKLNEIMKELSSTWGEEISFSNLDSALKDMKVELINKEYFHLMNSLPRNAKEMVYKKKLLEGVKVLHGKCKV
ncbi:uncharacterized protein RHO17_019745 [Thomomys bottae]